MTYRQYLQTNHWKALRQSAFEAAGFKCEFCKSTHRLRGHHTIYRRPLTNCTTADIMCLCEFHHEMWHKRHPSHCNHQRHHVLLYLANPRARMLRKIKQKEAKLKKRSAKL